MESRPPLSRIILAVCLAVVVVAVLVLLSLWTIRISQEKRSDELRRELERIGMEGGERALLALGGYEVDDIFYSDEGLLLFEEGSQSWRYSADEMQNIKVYEKCAGSVVEIYASSELSSSMGCGVVITSDGYIVTNTHVVSAGGKLTVKFLDGDELEASLVGSDPITDIAVIKVDCDEALDAAAPGRARHPGQAGGVFVLGVGLQAIFPADLVEVLHPAAVLAIVGGVHPDDGVDALAARRQKGVCPGIDNVGNIRRHFRVFKKFRVQYFGHSPKDIQTPKDMACPKGDKGIETPR